MILHRTALIPTLLALAAVAAMLRLGFWQLDRLEHKQAMIAAYQQAAADRSVHSMGEGEAAGYSRLRIECSAVSVHQSFAGRNLAGQPGWAHAALCTMPDGKEGRVVLGWSARPDTVRWQGGTVIGTVVPREDGLLQVVADPPLAGLAANARPDPRDIPNNHLSYAIQWFLFAATALAIYALALRKRLAGSGSPR